MYLLLENLKGDMLGFKKDDKNDFYQFELNIPNIKKKDYYRDLVKFSWLIFQDHPLKKELFIDPKNPITLSFWDSDGVSLTKYFYSDDDKITWSSKIGYLIDTFEDEDFKSEYIDELKIIFKDNDKLYEQFKKDVKF